MAKGSSSSSKSSSSSSASKSSAPAKSSPVASPSKTVAASSKPVVSQKSSVAAPSKSAAVTSSSSIAKAYTQAANSMKAVGVASVGAKVANKTAAVASSSSIVKAYTQAANSMKAVGVASVGAKVANKTAAVASSSSIVKAYNQAANSMKAVGVSSVGGKVSATTTAQNKPSANAINNQTLGFVGYAAMGITTSLETLDRKAANTIRNTAANIMTKGPAKNFPANVKKATDLAGTGTWMERVASNKAYGTLSDLGDGINTKPTSKSATYVTNALQANTPLSKANYGKLVKGFSIVGFALDPALGVYNGYANTPANASTGQKITNSIIGGLKKVDNVAAAAFGGAVVGVGTAVTGPGAIALGAAGGIAAEQVYSRSGLDLTIDKGVDTARPVIEATVNMAISGVTKAQSLATSAWNASSGLFYTR